MKFCHLQQHGWTLALCQMKRQRKTDTVYLLYVESKKYNKLVNIVKKKKQTDRYREQTSGYQWGEGRGREFGISRCKLWYTEWINIKVLLYSTGNYIQYPIINHNGKEYEKECIYTHTHTHTYIHIHMYKWITLLYTRN